MPVINNAVSLTELTELLGKAQRIDDVPALLQGLDVVIEGQQLSGNIDYQVAQAIVQLQQIVYRIAAHTLYGENATIKNLGDEELDRYRLSFSIAPGCTHISARLAEKFLELLNAVFENMTPGHKITLAAILAGSFLGYYGITSYEDYLKNVNQEQVRLKISQEETRRLDLILSHVHESGDEASTAFAKSVKGADNLRFGAREFSTQELSEIQKRTPRSSVEWITEPGAFVVLSLDCTKPDVIWTVLIDTETGEQFKASYIIDEETSDTSLLLTALAKSLATGTAVRLTVSKGRKNNDASVVFKASLLGLTEPSEP